MIPCLNLAYYPSPGSGYSAAVDYIQINGAICLNTPPTLPISQFSNSSVLCNDAHSVTKPKTLGGK